VGQRPNELWCTDYKGEFLLGNHQYCYPLTVTDHASRFLLTCEALSSTCEAHAFTVFERLFQERGLPANIRSDNGVPFASAHALFHLSKLAVWWLRLGIGIERIRPGHPQPPPAHPRNTIYPRPERHTEERHTEDRDQEITMQQRLIRYRTKPDQAAANTELVRAVYAELHQTRPDGFRYATLMLDDQVTFVHIVQSEHDPSPIVAVKAFGEFQAGIMDRCDQPPAQQAYTEIGSYRFLTG